MIIDGGQCKNGLESTVVDLFTGDIPAILRPGAVTAEMIISVAKGLRPSDLGNKNTPISPGMKYRHYAPKAPLILVTGTNFDEIVDDYKKKGERVGILSLNKNSYEEAAFSLYERLRDFDKSDVSLIIAEAVPEEGVGAAVMNRLRKAAAKVV
jgi:L-threonylcarbamoyladenylate synthase